MPQLAYSCLVRPPTPTRTPKRHQNTRQLDLFQPPVVYLGLRYRGRECSYAGHDGLIGYSRIPSTRADWTFNVGLGRMENTFYSNFGYPSRGGHLADELAVYASVDGDDLVIPPERLAMLLCIDTMAGALIEPRNIYFDGLYGEILAKCLRMPEGPHRYHFRHPVRQA